jgi:hypothetical protein
MRVMRRLSRKYKWLASLFMIRNFPSGCLSENLQNPVFLEKTGFCNLLESGRVVDVFKSVGGQDGRYHRLAAVRHREGEVLKITGELRQEA